MPSRFTGRLEPPFSVFNVKNLERTARGGKKEEVYTLFALSIYHQCQWRVHIFIGIVYNTFSLLLSEWPLAGIPDSYIHSDFLVLCKYLVKDLGIEIPEEVSPK